MWLSSASARTAWPPTRNSPPSTTSPFILLSDPELIAIQAYGVWQEKKLYGKVSMGVVRTTFVVGENGVIQKVMPKVKPDTNAAEVLEMV